MVSVDIQKLIDEKVRFQVEVDIRVGGYIDTEPETQTVAHMVMKDLTKEESEMVITNVVDVLNWVEDQIEPEE